MSKKFFVLMMVLIVVAGGVGLYAAINHPGTPANKMRAEVEKVKAECIVIGNAADYNKTQGHFMRTIYQCPDGTIKIR